MNNLGHGRFVIFPILAIFLSLMLSAVVPASASTRGVGISSFYVTPYQAPLGARVTAGVTVLNLDPANPVSVTVTLTDGGIVVATSKQPLDIPAGGSATTQFQFKTATSPAHCYLASTSSPTAAAYSTGFCEAGNILGGTSLAVNTFFVLVPYMALAGAAVGVLSIVSLRRRRKD